MPLTHKAQLIETATPMLYLWALMEAGLRSRAPTILEVLNYSAERDLEPRGAGWCGPLDKDEVEELGPVIRALMDAAMASEAMPDRIIIATLRKIARDPAHFCLADTPAAVQWEMACDYKRGNENARTFSLDIWGSEQTRCPYLIETPTDYNIARAALASLHRIKLSQKRGRPHNCANQLVAERLGAIFRSTGRTIRRHHEPVAMAKGRVVYAERGSFKEFIELVLPPLQEFLRVRGLSPITVDSVVRLAARGAKTPIARPWRSTPK